LKIQGCRVKIIYVSSWFYSSYFMGFKQYSVLVIFLLLAVSTNGGVPPPPPPSSGPGPVCWPPPCIPIDGGITLLIAAGAAYGAKKIYTSRKKAEADQ
jgi:hypothetical protein